MAGGIHIAVGTQRQFVFGAVPPLQLNKTWTPPTERESGGESLPRRRRGRFRSSGLKLTKRKQCDGRRGRNRRSHCLENANFLFPATFSFPDRTK